MTETTERVQAEPGDFYACTTPIEDIVRWTELERAAEAAQGRLDVLGKAVLGIDTQIEELDHGAQDRAGKRAEAEEARRVAVSAKDVGGIKAAAGDIAAFDALDEFDAAERESLEGRRRELAEHLIPDAQAEAEAARSAAEDACPVLPSRRLVARLVAWQIQRLAGVALVEDGGDIVELAKDFAHLPDQVARHAYEDREWFEAMVEGMEARPVPVPTQRTPAERDALLKELQEEHDRDQQVLDAKRWGAEQMQFAAAVQADTASMGGIQEVFRR